MDNKQIMLAILAIISLLLSTLAQQMAAFAAAFAVIGYLYGRNIGQRDCNILPFSKELYALYSTSGLLSALRSACSMPSTPKEIVALDRHLLAGELDVDTSSISDPNVRELSGMIALGISSGKDMHKSLELFISKLEEQTENRNRVIQNSLNMETLSSIGIMFFIPLFGGIGASIIGASMAISGSSAFAAKTSFEIAVIAYIAVMCYLTSLFKSQDSLERRTISVINGVVIGTSLIRFTALFMSYAI